MYLWKHWRDTRVRLIIALTFVVIIWALYALLEIGHSGHYLAVGLYWQQFAARSWLFFPHCLLVIGLAARGPGEEFAQGTSDFLFTRPHSRRYFIWASWAMGAGQSLAIVFVYVLAAFVAAVYMTRTLYTWKFLAIVLPVLIMSLVAYSIVYLMTTLLRNKRSGYGSGVGLIVAYAFLEPLLRLRWNIHMPYPQHLMTSFANLVGGAHAAAPAFHFPVVSVLGWSLFALSCPLLAQLYIERSEI